MTAVPVSLGGRVQWPPGTQRRVHTADGRTLLAVALGDGAVVAIEERCPHKGGPLSAGRLMANQEIECPWHRFRFSLESGRCSAGVSQLALRHFPVTLSDDEWVVWLEGGQT